MHENGNNDMRREYESDYEIIIDEILSGHDLGSEVGRKRAYRECVRYAEDNLSGNMRCNAFIARAAERLGQTPMMLDVADTLAAPTPRDLLHVYFSDNSGVEISGNSEGLKYLARVLQNLAKSSLPGEHVHVYPGENALIGDSDPLAVYLEKDEWFREPSPGSGEDQQGEDDMPEIPLRAIDPETVKAFVVTASLPIALMMSTNRLYLVQSVRPAGDEEGTWRKSIRPGSERQSIFGFVNDEGQRSEIALDLDDEEVVFMTLADLEQLKGFWKGAQAGG